MGISRLALRNPRKKCHLGVNPVVKHRVYYKGKGGGSSLGHDDFCESEFARDSS
jgi:hypothetical protein